MDAKMCILANSVLAKVDEAARGSAARAGPGEPDRLSETKAAMAAIRGLEERTPSVANVTAFRESEAFAAYHKRWNLAAYFNVRMGEIAGEMTSFLDDFSLVRAVEGQTGGFAGGDGGDVKVLERSWSDDVVCVHAADKPLAAQIVARYGSWVKMGADAVGTEPRAVEQPVTPNDPDGQPRRVVPSTAGMRRHRGGPAAIRGDCEALGEGVDPFVPGMSDTLRTASASHGARRGSA